MSMQHESPIKRRPSTRIYVGDVPIGDGAPIAVQSMTNTRTTDVAATVAQIKSLEKVGADIVRVSVPTMEAAEAFKLIKQQVSVPLVADIHFDYRIALKVAEYGVDCLRINRAISVTNRGFAQWWIVRATKAFRFELGSMAAR